VECKVSSFVLFNKPSKLLITDGIAASFFVINAIVFFVSMRKRQRFIEKALADHALQIL
jgi:hypothetical protein